MSTKFKQFLAATMIFFAFLSPAVASDEASNKVYPMVEGQAHQAEEVLYTIAWIDNYRPNTIIVYTYDDYGNWLTTNYVNPNHYLELYNYYNVGYFNIMVTNLNDKILYDGRIYNGQTLSFYK